MTKEKIETMKEMLEIQGSDGNWNYSSSMHGMYNGMELMMALAEGREPVYKDAPDQWLEDKEDDSNPVKAKEDGT